MENYRNRSKKWRDKVTKYLTGNISTSSQKYQDNVFENNAIPPEIIKELATINKHNDGVIEKHIYQTFGEKQGKLFDLHNYITQSKPDTFKLKKFTSLFFTDPGLKRSIDKAYEIAVFALFETLVKHLKAEVSLSVPESSGKLVIEFEDFAKILLGINSKNLKASKPAALYRAGVTNAADKGLDIWANFGPAVQVKHITLNSGLATNMVDEIRAAKVVIVCKNAESKTITAILKQVGLSTSIQGIITEDMLEDWYSTALTGKNMNTLGKDLLNLMALEFEAEFPSIDNFSKFFTSERHYHQVKNLDEI